MTTYYIESDGNGGTTGGDGSIGSPFGTLAEMDGSITLTDGDTVYIDTETNGPLLESWSKSGLTGITFENKPGTALARILNVEKHVVEIAHDIGGGDSFDTYKSAAGVLGFTPESIIEDWDATINGDKIRKGFLKSYGTFAELRANKGYLYSAGRLWVSVPDTETTVGRTYYAGKTGDVVTLTNPTRVTFNNISFELATESGNGNGYGLRILGVCADVIINDCMSDGCQYHSVGSVGTGTNGFTLNRFNFGSVKAGTDSHFVVYTSDAALQNVVLNSPKFYATPWLDVDGNALEAGSVKNFASHHLSGADPTPAGGIIINNMQSFDRGFNPTHNHYDFALTANNTNHSAPTDKDDPDTYPIIVRDSVLGCHGAQVGGGINSNAHMILVRCQAVVDASSVVNGLATNGHFSVQAGAGSTATLGMVSCTLVSTLNDIGSRAMISNHNGGGEIVMHDCSTMLLGTYTQNVYELYASATSGLFRAHGCVFSKGDKSSTVSTLGGAVAAFTLFDFAANFYDDDLHTTFHDFTGTSMASWESIYDTTGVFDQLATFVDDNTLEPDATMKAIKNTAQPTGPRGINNKAYSLNFGAWQYWGDFAIRSVLPKIVSLSVANNPITRSVSEQARK